MRCGAGLISIAALSAGVARVVAFDHDPTALQATESNVLQADYRQLGLIRADLALANPPQRPGSILGAVTPEDRHLHDGGGEDGLASVRLILQYAGAAEVWTTAAAVLSIGTLRMPG